MSFNLSQIVNSFLNTKIINSEADAVPVQVTGGNVVYNINNVNSAFNFGEANPIDLGFDTGDAEHRSFGGFCAGRNDELYVVFRAGYGHGIEGGQGGHLYYAVSYDYGKTWGDAILFLSAPEGRDYRDATLSYDPIYDKFYLVYTDVSTAYQTGTREMHILRGDTPFVDMEDVTPNPRPLDFMFQTFHTVERHGSYLYLTYYGKQTGDTTWRAGLMRSTAGNNWKNLKTWDADGDNECTVFFSFNETNHLSRINMAFRRGDEMSISYSDDAGVTWSEKQGLGFDVAGGPRVFQVNDMYMLVARDQSNTSPHSYIYAMYSKDGVNWSKRERIGNVGPGYPTLVRFKNGRSFLGYSEEYSIYARLYLREIYNLPKLD